MDLITLGMISELSGDTYSKEQVNELIADINQFNVEVVDTLPSSNIDTHKIYFKKESDNITHEYMYVDNHWEEIGNTSIDLSAYLEKTDAANTYLTKTDANTTYVNKTDAGNTYLTKSNAENTYLTKSDASNSYVTKTGTATQTTAGSMSADDKKKLDGIASGATNVTTDTVSGWGYTKNTGTVTSVAVKMNGAVKGTVTSSGTIDLGTVPTGDKVDNTNTNALNVITLESTGYLVCASNPNQSTQSIIPQNNSNQLVLMDKINSDYTKLEKKMDKSNPIGTGFFSLNRREEFTVGEYSFAEGSSTAATGFASHSEGCFTEAHGNFSHAEGYRSTASGETSHAEGEDTTASGNGSHAEGGSTTASSNFSHAEGYRSTTSNIASHASGKHNAAMITGGTISNTTGTAFVIGNGTSSSAKSNAFSVQYNGTVKAKSTITASTTADYAEFFEWLDENPNNEDRVGLFVTLDGDKIRIANNDDDYILGVISGHPFVLGNGDCDTWNGMYMYDEYRRVIMEPAPKVEEILNEDGRPTGEYKEIEGEYQGTRPVINPDYDSSKPYVSRFDRPEWSPVGMLGVLPVRHDGTAKVNGYVTVNKDGIATACDKNVENSYRVIKTNSDEVVEIIFR